MLHIDKPVRVQALFPQPLDEALGKRILNRFPGLAGVELDHSCQPGKNAKFEHLTVREGLDGEWLGGTKLRGTSGK